MRTAMQFSPLSRSSLTSGRYFPPTAVAARLPALLLPTADFTRLPCGLSKTATACVSLGVSKLRRADYTQHLAGKTVLRVTWHNEPDEDYRCLSIFFTDETMVSFRFHTFVDEEAELADFIGGNLSNERLITPAPITRPTKDGE